MESFLSSPTRKVKPLPAPPPGTGGFTPGNAGPTPTPSTPGMSPFGPGNSLIGTQINPTTSGRGANAAGMTDRAAGAVSGYQFQPFKSVTANTGQSQGIYDNLLRMAQGGGGVQPVSGVGAQLSGSLQPLLDKVTNAPDRGQLAQDMYGVLEERARPGFEQRLRSVSQKAGALGRVGLGLTTSELGDVETVHNRDLDLSRRQLAAEGAGQSLDDRLKQLMAAKDVYGAVSNANNAASRGAQELDQTRFSNLLTLGRDIYGRESDDFGRRAGERDTGLGYDQSRFGNERSRLSDMSNYESDIYGRDRDARDEYRGERGYQYGLERDALGDRERQYGMEEDARQRDWQRAFSGAQFGYGQNPAGAFNAAGTQQSQQAQDQLATLGPLFLEWARKQQGATVRPPSATPYDDAAV